MSSSQSSLTPNTLTPGFSSWTSTCGRVITGREGVQRVTPTLLDSGAVSRREEQLELLPEMQELQGTTSCTRDVRSGGALPSIRLTPSVCAFTIAGMDYFGPMTVSVGRRREKRYGVLFTCMSTRAVHLEIAHDLSTDSFIMAIRRMIGRRGQPRQICSDNGTNLRGADRELRESLASLTKTVLPATSPRCRLSGASTHRLHHTWAVHGRDW